MEKEDKVDEVVEVVYLVDGVEDSGWCLAVVADSSFPTLYLDILLPCFLFDTISP